MPVVGVEDDAEKLLGFASYGTFRAWPAYKYRVEHSVCIYHDFRGQGLGKLLMLKLIEEATACAVHTMIPLAQGNWLLDAECFRG